jgi:hypothetical protein
VIRRPRARTRAPRYQSEIKRGQYPCVCASVDGLHHHLIRQTAAYMPEAELLRVARMIATVYAVRAVHQDDSRQQTEPGIPDLIMAGRNGVLWRELKSHYGTLSPDQRGFGSLLGHAGEDWAIWRPVDLINSTVETQIARIA